MVRVPSGCRLTDMSISPHVSPSALLVVAPTCVGFLSYNYEKTVTTATNLPLRYPDETFIWATRASATTAALVVTQFSDIGTDDPSVATGCTESAGTFTDGCWENASSRRRLGNLLPTTARGAGPLFAYYSQEGAITATIKTSCDGSDASATTCYMELATIVSISIDVRDLDTGASASSHTVMTSTTIIVPVYESIYAEQSGAA